jgi:hypothetical protein
MQSSRPPYCTARSRTSLSDLASNRTDRSKCVHALDRRGGRRLPTWWSRCAERGRKLNVNGVGVGAHRELLPPAFGTPPPRAMAHLRGPDEVVDAAHFTVARIAVVVALLLLLVGRKTSIDVVLLAVNNVVIDVDHGDVTVLVVSKVVVHVEHGDVVASSRKFVVQIWKVRALQKNPLIRGRRWRRRRHHCWRQRPRCPTRVDPRRRGHCRGLAGAASAPRSGGSGLHVLRHDRRLGRHLHTHSRLQTTRSTQTSTLCQSSAETL